MKHLYALLILFALIASNVCIAQGGPPPCGITELTGCNDASFIGDSVTVDLTELNTTYPFCYTNSDYTKYNPPTHYTSLEDANAATNAIVNPESYEAAISYNSNGQVIYARAEPIEAGLPILVDIFCEVKGAEPPSVSVSDYTVLDENGDGYAVFDLEAKSIEIANSSNFLFTYVTFHLTEEDAVGDTNSIFGNYENTVQNEQIIYARASPDFNPACFSYHEMKLIASNSLSAKKNTEVLFSFVKNPVNHSIDILFRKNEDLMYNLSLVNILGNRVRNETITAAAHYTMDVSKLQSGVYFLSIQDGIYSETKKLIIK